MCTIKAILLQEWFVGETNVTPLVWCQQSKCWVHWIQWRAENGMFSLLLGHAREGCRVLMLRILRPVLTCHTDTMPSLSLNAWWTLAPKPSQVSLRVHHMGIRNFLWDGGLSRGCLSFLSPHSPPVVHPCAMSWR